MNFMIKNYTLAALGSPGAFGAVRRHDIHTGVDIYTDLHEPVYAIEDGVVVAIERFTGESADSPWWNDTLALLVEGKSGVVVYGEIDVAEDLTVGSEVKQNDYVGNVLQVLKQDKGVTPTCMLHFELHKHGTTQTCWWHHGEAMPNSLLDPTELLNELFTSGGI